ncbi:MAG TPA: hypothetical protein VF331_00815 [Polyangiales bacterium]
MRNAVLLFVFAVVVPTAFADDAPRARSTFDQKAEAEFSRIRTVQEHRRTAFVAARAAELADQCRASFPDRLADARQALAAFDAAQQAYKAAANAAEWFGVHCRFLSELEIAIRKLDDPNSFVCDTRVGRPKRLTAEIVSDGQAEPVLRAYQDRANDDDACAALDAAERMSLVEPEQGALARTAFRIELLCYGDERPSCVKARAAIAAKRKQ